MRFLRARQSGNVTGSRVDAVRARVEHGIDECSADPAVRARDQDPLAGQGLVHGHRAPSIGDSLVSVLTGSLTPRRRIAFVTSH
jgi:hypothetical protein